MTVVLCDETRTARTPHACIWCGEQINPGERYRYQRVIFDREPQSNCWHPECLENADIRDLLEGFTPGEGQRPRLEANGAEDQP